MVMACCFVADSIFFSVVVDVGVVAAAATVVAAVVDIVDVVNAVVATIIAYVFVGAGTGWCCYR